MARVDKEQGRPEFVTPKCAFWDTNFKLAIKKQKTQKELSTLPFLPKIFREKPALQSEPCLKHLKNLHPRIS